MVLIDGSHVTLTLGVERVHSSLGPEKQKAPGTAEKVIECLFVVSVSKAVTL